MMNELITLCNTNEHLATRYHWYLQNDVMHLIGDGIEGTLTTTVRKESNVVEYELVIDDNVIARNHLVDSDDVAYDLMKAIRKEIV
jgi:hypothetical protein